MTKPVPPIPDENKSTKGPHNEADVPRDTTKGHARDETRNIDEQGNRANVRQNTSNRRSG